MASFQLEGGMSFYNQHSRPSYLSAIELIKFRERTVDLDGTHGHFVGQAVTLLSEIKEADFNAPRTLSEKVWDKGARQRFVEDVSGCMANFVGRDNRDERELTNGPEEDMAAMRVLHRASLCLDVFLYHAKTVLENVRGP